MLVNLKEILAIAEENKCAIGAFNAANLESLHAIISAAEETNQPVVLMHAQVHEEMGVANMDEMAPIMLRAAKLAKVPVCVHLDHGTSIDYIKNALELGFTGIMYDGSALPYEENVANTKKVVELATKYGASVEAEIGCIGEECAYTDPDTATKFVKETGIDALACGFGTVHGFYLKEPKLDFERLSKIDSLVDIPLVMHGGSGVSKEDYKKVISRGVRKINYYTYMAKAGAAALCGKEYKQFHDVVRDAEKGMKENLVAAIGVFSGKE